jgi:hypothetical protein
MKMYYYSGSILPIEWTDQHGCGGNSKVSCEIVLQYACEDTLDPLIDNFWPWVTNKGDPTTTYYGKQHFRYTDGAGVSHIGAPRDGVPTDANDAATDTIGDDEADAIPSTTSECLFYLATCCVCASALEFFFEKWVMLFMWCHYKLVTDFPLHFRIYFFNF